MARLRGLDRGRVKRMKRTLESILNTDGQREVSNPRNKPISFPTTDAPLTAAVVAVHNRLTALLEQV